MTLQALSAREASIFACLCQTVVAPAPPLPPVRQTDAVEFLDDWLAHAPRLNRVGLRALLYAAELAPRAVGLRRRLRALDDSGRALALERVERSRHARLRQLAKVLKGMAFLSYYGDHDVLHELGYHPEDVVARGRFVRDRDGRP